MVTRQTKQNKALVERARYLIFVKGFSQKETAKILGVSEKTMSQWKKKYFLKMFEATDGANVIGLETYMEDFFVRLKESAPELEPTFRKLWNSFLKKYESSIDKMIE